MSPSLNHPLWVTLHWCFCINCFSLINLSCRSNFTGPRPENLEESKEKSFSSSPSHLPWWFQRKAHSLHCHNLNIHSDNFLESSTNFFNSKKLSSLSYPYFEIVYVFIYYFFSHFWSFSDKDAPKDAFRLHPALYFFPFLEQRFSRSPRSTAPAAPGNLLKIAILGLPDPWTRDSGVGPCGLCFNEFSRNGDAGQHLKTCVPGNLVVRQVFSHPPLYLHFVSLLMFRSPTALKKKKNLNPAPPINVHFIDNIL